MPARLTKLLLRFMLLACLAPLATGAPPSGVEDARIEDVEFGSHGVTLSGSLVLPADLKPRAGVVFVHGSGPQARNLAWARRFAAAGIAALVYDKRGVGKSGGVYEANQSVSGPNISLLADDAAAALERLSAHPLLAGKPTGLTGISQAGWIVPLAAERDPRARFLLLWSGPVCKVSEEDIYSKYTGDADAAQVPPYREALAARTQPYLWPEFLGVDSDPASSLRKVAVPGLWIFGANDGSIPVDLSIERLKSLQSEGRRYEFVRVAAAGHNNMDQTFDTATRWILALH